MTVHFHSADLVDGVLHVHPDIESLDQYLRATVTDDAREYIVKHAEFHVHGGSLGERNAMRVYVCTDDFATCERETAEAQS